MQPMRVPTNYNDPTSAKKRSIQGRLAAATRDGKPKKELDALRRDFSAARLEMFITAEVAKAPALTPDQLARIVALLRPRP